jgi:biotin transporter BioY
MTIEDGTAIVLAYVLVSMGVIIAFLLAAFVIGWFIGRLRQHRRNSAEKSNLTGGGRAGAFFGQTSEL